MNSVIAIVQSMQTSITEQLSMLNDKVNDVAGRMEVLESRQKSLENEVKSLCSTKSTVSTIPGKRKRITIPALQVKVCIWCV